MDRQAHDIEFHLLLFCFCTLPWTPRHLLPPAYTAQDYGKSFPLAFPHKQKPH